MFVHSLTHFFLALDNIPLSGGTTVYLSIYLLINVYKWINRDCFQVLAIMNKAAITMCRILYEQNLLIYFGKYQRA